MLRQMCCWWWGALSLMSAAFLCAEETPPARDPAAWIDRRIDPVQRQFWAFRPLPAVSVPCGDDPAGAHPIDRFLAEAQRRDGLATNGAVDRRILLRRLHFDLIGLPPSPDDVAAFCSDDSPDAVERCVDRLLASPHYGVRWGRHWLDIARFAESHGFEHDYDRLTAYHYRDFVVHAWNADQPFDEFVRWQIAGDRLAPENRHAWMATGFLAAGPHSTQITKREIERQRYDELDDMVSTIGTALLGLNIGCARCHDHPYDPIPQGDFYRFAAFFTRTVRSDVEFDFDPAGYRAAQAAFVKAHSPFDAVIAQYEATGLRSAYQEWRRRATPEQLQATWLLPDKTAIASRGASQWTSQRDGSWVIASAPLGTDRYEITLRPNAAKVTALRLEALTHGSMTHGGPGRAADGTFLLSRVQLEHIRPEAAVTPLAIRKAEATFEQVGAEVAGVLDDRDATAWGIDPQLGRPHTAVFHLAHPVEIRRDEELRLVLEFVTQPQAALGRLRVSFSAEAHPPLHAESPPIPENVARARQRDPATFKDADWSAVTRWFASQDPEWLRLDTVRQEHAAMAPQPTLRTVLVATEGRPAIRLHTQATEEFLPETQYLHRGDPLRPLGVAVPNVLQLFPPAEGRTPTDRPGLARWMTDVEHGAGALLARVIVNRLWQHHFGTGLVGTPDDFGVRGEPPTHPDLLEWLAGELIRHDWHIKPLQRLMVTSAAFRRSSFHTAEAMEKDPDNRTLWRWLPRRLDAEALRDTQLSVSELLDDRFDGPSEREALHHRRSSYTFTKRSAPDEWLTNFDAPDGCRVEGRRPRTTSPKQALMLFNSELTRAAAEHLAVKCLQQADPIEALFQQVLQRSPTPAERRRRLLLDDTAVTWVDICQVMLCLDECVFLD